MGAKVIPIHCRCKLLKKMFATEDYTCLECDKLKTKDVRKTQEIPLVPEYPIIRYELIDELESGVTPWDVALISIGSLLFFLFTLYLLR